MNVTRYVFKVALLSAGLAVFGCSTTGFAAIANVGVGNGGVDKYSPPITNINVGDTVIWSWNEGASIPHAVLSTNSTPAFGVPMSFTQPHFYTNVFTVAGNFPYYCIVHLAQHMTGAVMVAAISLPPSVAITNPASGAVFAAPANITIQASASDNGGGSVTNVQFLVDANIVTNDPTAPFSAVTNNLAVGGHTLSAIASDSNGLTGTNSIAISVVSPVSVLLSAPQTVPPGKFRFTYSANTGLSYFVQRSTNLLSANWTSFGTNMAGSGSIDFTDLTATFNPAFYRVGRVPNP